MHPGHSIADYVERTHRNKTELAKELGMSRVNFYAILRGTQRISPKSAVKIEEVLGFEAERLLATQAEYDLWQACIALEEFRSQTPMVEVKQMSFAMS